MVSDWPRVACASEFGLLGSKGKEACREAMQSAGDVDVLALLFGEASGLKLEELIVDCWDKPMGAVRPYMFLRRVTAVWAQRTVLRGRGVVPSQIEDVVASMRFYEMAGFKGWKKVTKESWSGKEKGWKMWFDE